MIATKDDALAAVARLESVLASRANDLVRADDYYRGKHPLAFASDQFKDAFGGLFARFSDNWCGVVVDSVAERLEVTGFRAEDSADADAESWRVWRRAHADTDSNLAFIDALVGARSFALVWGNPDDESVPSITFEHASQVAVEYAPGSRRKRAAALKLWREDEAQRANLYTADHVWKFARPASSLGLVSGGGWMEHQPVGEPWPLPHPIGDVPVVELQNRPRLAGEPAGELTSVIPMQDTVNLIWSHLITASDFAAYPQRVVLGTDQPTRPVLNAAGAVVGERDLTPEELKSFRAGRIQWLSDPNAKIDEWSAADLSNYVKVIEVAVQHLAAQTKTPPHYLLGQMVNISGDALAAAEAGLVSKVMERQDYFGDGVLEVMRLAHLAAGNASLADAVSGGTVLWRDPQHRTESEHVDALMKMKALGVPEEALWERMPGVDQTEIARWKAMREDAAARIVGGDLLGVFGPKPETDLTLA